MTNDCIFACSHVRARCGVGDHINIAVSMFGIEHLYGKAFRIAIDCVYAYNSTSLVFVITCGGCNFCCSCCVVDQGVYRPLVRSKLLCNCCERIECRSGQRNGDLVFKTLQRSSRPFDASGSAGEQWCVGISRHACMLEGILTGPSGAAQLRRAYFASESK